MRSAQANEFKGVITNSTARPSNSGYGSNITPGNNSFPAYSEILANTAFECFGIYINVNSVSAAGAAKDGLLTLGFDHAGGTTYTDNTISNLLVSCASQPARGGVDYYFPLYIPEGTAIAAKGSVNNATVGGMRVLVRLYGRPTRPELVRAGAYVDSFGATTASSSGTAITSGTASEGSWTEVTSGTTTKPYWWFQSGFGCNDLTMTSGLIYFDDLSVGDATNKGIVFEDQVIMIPTANEEVARPLLPYSRYVCDVPDGQRIYSRMQCSGTADSSLSVMAYALGG